MKKAFLLFTITCISLWSFAQKSFQSSNDHPASAQSFTITAGAGAEIRTIYRIIFSGEGSAIPDKGQPGRYDISGTDSTAGYFLITHSGSQVVDQADIIVCSPMGKKTPVKGGYLALFNFVKKSRGEVVIPDADSLAVAYLTAEFQAFPEEKRRHLADYLFALATFKKRAAAPQVLSELAALAKEKNLSSEEVLLLYNLYDLYEQPALSAKYAEMLKERHESGKFILEQQKVAILKDEQYKQKLDYYKAMQVDQPTWIVYHLAVNELLKAGDYAHVDELLSSRPKEVVARTYMSVAVELILQRQDLNMADKYAQWAFEAAKHAIEHPGSSQQSERVDKFNLCKGYEVRADLLTLHSKFAEALPLFDSAKKYGELFPMADIEALYLQTMAHSDRYAEVKPRLEELAKKGAMNPIKLDALKAAYERSAGGKSDGFNAYYASMAAIQRDSTQVHLTNTMIKMPAPDFTLEDLQGNKVSLSSLRGKVVVIDFWATWCGPCVASFPYMDKAQEKYKSDDQVVFLFLDSWESGTASRPKIADFLKNRNVTFGALLDKEDKTITAYGVKGIPTKFIIDRNGNIRFNVVGNPKDMDELIPELTAMIELVKKS